MWHNLLYPPTQADWKMLGRVAAQKQRKNYPQCHADPARRENIPVLASKRNYMGCSWSRTAELLAMARGVQCTKESNSFTASQEQRIEIPALRIRNYDSNLLRVIRVRL
jgi:hypothetical protein